MGNHEEKLNADRVHILMAFKRTKDGQQAKCLRRVIKHTFEEDLAVLKAELQVLGGEWRIHKTVNIKNL